MENLRTGVTPDWQTEAYLGHLINEGDICAALTRTENLSVLMDKSSFLVKHTRNLLNSLYMNSESVPPALLSLIRKVLDEMSFEEAFEIHQTFHCDYGLVNSLRSSSWDEQFVLALNKFSLSADDKSTNKEILILSVEDGSGFIDNVLANAADDGGKVRTCAQILLVVSHLCKEREKDGSFILVQKILRILLDEEQIDEIRRQNIFNLLLTLGNSEPDFCLQVISRVVSYIFSEISNEGITFKILSYTNLFLDVLKIDIVRTMLSKEFKSKLGVPFALELNVVSAISLPTDNQLKFKEHAIDILKRTFASHEELTNILSEDNLNYFKKGSDISVSLRQKINQNYFKSVTEEVVLDVSHSDQESGQLMELVPTLMPVEWRLVCRSDLGPRLIPTITELLFYLDIDSHVCYRVLRSLCSELQNSWTMLIQLIR